MGKWPSGARLQNYKWCVGKQRIRRLGSQTLGKVGRHAKKQIKNQEGNVREGKATKAATKEAKKTESLQEGTMEKKEGREGGLKAVGGNFGK